MAKKFGDSIYGRKETRCINLNWINWSEEDLSIDKKPETSRKESKRLICTPQRNQQQ